jgi:uncharacterized protein (TIGR03437 family)
LECSEDEVLRLTSLTLLASGALLVASSDAGGVLAGLTVASFSGSGVNTIQAVATDASGNYYVAGSTSSFDFGVKNAAQPVIGEARILRSTDLGVTWTRLGLPPTDVSVIAPDPVAPQILFATGTGGIFRSVDGGQAWTTVYPSSAGALVIDPGNHLRIAALTGSNLIRSLDGGNTWSPGASTAGSLLVDPTGSGTLIAGSFGLSISRDWGLTFQLLNPGTGWTPTVAAFDPSNPGWIYIDSSAGSQGRLAMTKDFGATWTPKASPSDIFSAMLGLQVDPSQPSVLVAATPDGFFKSSDGANTWARQTGSPGSGRFSPDGYHPFVLVNHTCSPNGGLFAIGDGLPATYSVDFSADDGVTWNTPSLTGVSNVALGPNCTAYVTRSASTDAFVAKVAPDGTVLWATYLGGADQDAAVALAVDSQGNCYVTGYTASTDFPAIAPMIGIKGEEYTFVAKYSPSGANLYSVLMGAETVNTPSAIAVDLSGNTYVTGGTDPMGFPVTPGVIGTSMDAGSSTGFLIKLSANALPVYSTYLGPLHTYPGTLLVDSNNEVIIAGTGSAPSLPAASQNGATGFIVKLNQTATRVLSAAYLDSVNPQATPTGLAMDPQGNLLVLGSTVSSTFTATQGAYSSPSSTSGCAISEDYLEGSQAFLLKLNPSSFQPVYAALLSSPCGVETGGVTVDSSGAALLSLATGAGFTLLNPQLAGPTCGQYSSALAKLSADGSTLQFATYLTGCNPTPIALAGGVLAGVSSTAPGIAAAVLRIGTSGSSGISLNGIANAFSGDASAVTSGGLYALSVSGFQPAAVNLGITPAKNLPFELEGVQVFFDNEPAAIMAVAPGSILVVTPERIVRPTRGEKPIKFTSVRIAVNGALSSPVWMPLATTLPGLLTKVLNQDGSVNSIGNPAAVGSTITAFVTGMGSTNHTVVPGSAAQSTSIIPNQTVYPSWQVFSLRGPNPAATVETIPGTVSAIFQIPLVIPSTATNNAQSVGNGIFLVPLGLQLQLAFEFIPPVSNEIGVYVR